MFLPAPPPASLQLLLPPAAPTGNAFWAQKPHFRRSRDRPRPRPPQIRRIPPQNPGRGRAEPPKTARIPQKSPFYQNQGFSPQSAPISPPRRSKTAILGKIGCFLLNLLLSTYQKNRFLGKSRGFSSTWSHPISSPHQKYQFWGKSAGFSSISSYLTSPTRQKYQFWGKMGGFSSIWACPTPKNLNF